MDAKYRAKEIVWAKIEPYPWWPGKIINIHIQCNQIIYKVLFFADPTFAYLQESQMSPYSKLNPNCNANYPADSRLRKAIKLADDAQHKIESMRQCKEFKIGLQSKKTQPEIVQQAFPEVPTATKQNHTQNTSASESLLSLLPMHQQPIRQETAHSQVQEQNLNFNQLASHGQATKDNILEILSKRMKSQERFQYNYENRKKIIQNKIKLKRILLERYSLHHQYIGQEKIKQSKKIPNNQENKASNKGSKRYRIHRKKNQNQNIPELKDKCMRRLYQICRKMSRPQGKGTNCKEMCSDIVKRIFQISQQNQSKYQDTFLTLIKSIQENRIGQAKCAEKTLADFSIYLQKVQSQKQQDEQGSKLTQYPSISH